MSNNPNHFNRKMVNPGSFRTIAAPELVFQARPHDYIHRLWMNGCTFVQNKKTYKILSGAYDHRGDVIKFMDVVTKQEYCVTEKDFFSKVNKYDLKHPQ